MQYSTNFSNSLGTEQIVRKIGGSTNSGIRIKKIDQFKNTKHIPVASFFRKRYNIQIKLYELEESVNCTLLFA